MRSRASEHWGSARTIPSVDGFADIIDVDIDRVTVQIGMEDVECRARLSMRCVARSACQRRKRRECPILRYGLSSRFRWWSGYSSIAALSISWGIDVMGQELTRAAQSIYSVADSVRHTNTGGPYEAFQLP